MPARFAALERVATRRTLAGSLQLSRVTMSMPQYDWLHPSAPAQKSPQRGTSRSIPIEGIVFAMVLVLTAFALALGGA